MTLMLRPFNFDTLAVRVYELASDERLEEAATAAILIVVIGLDPGLAARRPAGIQRRLPPEHRRMTTSLPQYDPPSVLEIRDLEFAYGGGAPVIEGCHLAVRSGEVHCLLGCSGGGKTTLLRLIAGLERATGGDHPRRRFADRGAGRPPAPGTKIGRDGLPGLRLVPEPIGPGERRVRHSGGCHGGTVHAQCRRRTSTGWGCSSSRPGCRTRSAAVSSSGSRSRGRWCGSPG